MIKVKIVLIGPCKSGKSTIANFLSESIDYVSDEYHLTRALRILEFEVKNRGSETEIELWDCSGDIKYEEFWPVFISNAQGVVIVHDLDEKDQLEDVNMFYDRFVAKSSMPANNCIIVAHCKDPDHRKNPPKLSGMMTGVKHVTANVLEDGEHVKQIFENYIEFINDSKADYDSVINFPL